MKKIVHTLFAATMMLAMTTGCGNGSQNQVKETNDTIMNTELKPFDVQKDFADNGFTFFTKNLVLCCGDSTGVTP